MSETAAEATTGTEATEPVESPAQETDWKAEARKWEQRAKENQSKAKANTEAAKRLAEIEESQKTELQKLQERAEAAEKQAQELALAKDRAEVAAEKGVPANLLTGMTREDLEAHADALIAFRGEQKPTPSSSAFEKAGKPLALNGDGIENALRNALGI